MLFNKKKHSMLLKSKSFNKFFDEVVSKYPMNKIPYDTLSGENQMHWLLEDSVICDTKKLESFNTFVKGMFGRVVFVFDQLDSSGNFRLKYKYTYVPEKYDDFHTELKLKDVDLEVEKNIHE